MLFPAVPSSFEIGRATYASLIGNPYSRAYLSVSVNSDVNISALLFANCIEKYVQCFWACTYAAFLRLNNIIFTDLTPI